MKLIFYSFILFGGFLYAQPTSVKVTQNNMNQHDTFLEGILRQYPAYFSEIVANKDAWNVQIIYTRVNRDVKNAVQLTNHYFNVNGQQYFYPASTVKLPVALLALQRLHELGIDKNATMITEAAYGNQTAVYQDSTSATGKPTVANYIKKILLVSDNDAYNRLYEFLGQDYINNELHKKGYANAQILHRLDIALSEDENRHTNPVKFLNSDDSLLYQQSLQKSINNYPLRNDSLGEGYYADGKLINHPMSFSKKNRISLEELHQILISIIFPDKVPASQRFNITEDDRKFILQCMSQFPGESINPFYNSSEYWNAYCKFLLYGSEKKELPENVRIFNKVGDAYGHLIDVAYVVDFDKKIEFFLSAVIYCNSDGILNDDQYDYDTIGLPFMKNLGKVIYDYEVRRERKVQPDLLEFKFEYDK